jgi:hypothetical protein
MSAASDNDKGSSLGQAGISGDEMAEGLPKNLAGTTTSLPCAEYDAIVARFETSPDDCGRDDINKMSNRLCRKFETQVHLSMLVLTNTMVKVEDSEHLRNSNMRVNHNNPTKTASMEMMNNMAGNPINISDKNSNDSTTWGKDLEVYMTVYDKVCALKFRSVHYFGSKLTVFLFHMIKHRTVR